MTASSVFELLAFFLVLFLLARPLGRYLAWVFHPQGKSMDWRRYLAALLWFHAVGFVVLMGLQLLQSHLPGNPNHLPNVPLDLAINTAVSFLTNTNWQAYSGEAVMSQLTQMLGLGVQNFLSAATGMAVAAALARGLTGKSADCLGNFWLDVKRATFFVLLPLSAVLALIMVSQGVVQSHGPDITVTTMEGAVQVIPQGPAASQIAIKQLGTNGGGFFGVNSAHPFENPTPLSNFLQCLAILLIPAAFPFMLGRMTGRPQHGGAVFAAMVIGFGLGLGLSLWAEGQHNPSLGVEALLEGRETRFNTSESVLWATATTAASNGSVNTMHDSMMPLSGLVQLTNMLLGEVIFGGVGAGLYGMVMFVVLTIFIAGLMVGRTPEYLGKRIESGEIICAVAAVLIPSVFVLVGSALSVLTEAGRASLATNTGPHAFSEALYAWASAANNNGSAFGGLNANTPFYNYGLALAMLAGRFGVIIPVLIFAGRMAVKKSAPPGPGTFPSHGWLFVILLIGVIVIVGGLTFLPALSLGPVVEHLLMSEGRSF